MSNNNFRSSRRKFLQTAGIVSAGITADGVLSATPAVHAAGSDIIKIAIVGCGGRGGGSLIDRSKVGDAVKVVALADLNKAKVEKALTLFSKEETVKPILDLSPDRIFFGFDAHKKATDLADLVLIASPAGFHPDHYLYAVEQGKHVFMEKPFCVDPEGYRRCMKANKIAEEKGLTVCAGFQRRHEQKYQEWISRIHAGDIGDIISTRVYWNDHGIVSNRRPADGESELLFQIRNWYIFNWLCGDHIVEQHCHNIDVANWIHGKGDPMAHPVSCVGHGGRQTPRGNIFDHHYVEFRYADGSVIHSTCRQIANCWNHVGEIVSGTKGSGSGGWGGQWLVPTAGQQWKYKKNGDENPYVQEHIDQSEAMRKGKRLHDGWSAAHSSMTAVMGRMATYSGQEIKWDDAVAKGRILFPYDKELTVNTEPPIMPSPEGTYEHAVAIPGEYDPFEKSAT